MTDMDLRQRVMAQTQGALLLNVAYFGIVNGLFESMAMHGKSSPAQLAEATQRDLGYLTRWCDTAYAFELLDEHLCHAQSQRARSMGVHLRGQAHSVVAHGQQTPVPRKGVDRQVDPACPGI